MKDDDIRIIQICRKMQIGVVFSVAIAGGEYEFSLRVTISEFPNSLRQRSDVDICVKHPITSSRQKQRTF
jgi:hypothetical protein